MPSLPSSTSSETDRSDVIESQEELYKAFTSLRDGYNAVLATLDTILSEVHRDTGQYTVLAGYEASIQDAVRMIRALHKDNAALKARLAKLTNG